MKQFLPIALLATFFAAVSAHATVRTVNNGGTSPGQYTSLQTAINAANAGDTILVSGSGTDYASNGPIYVNTPVTLFGPGYNPIKDVPITATISYIDLQAGSTGTVIMGFNLGYITTDGNDGASNITIRRNTIGGIGANYTNGTNWVIEENMCGYNNNYGGSYNISVSNLIIKNNVFSGSPYTTITNDNNTNLIFSNNVIFNGFGYSGNSNQPFTFSNGIVNNNIFYDTTGADVVYFSTTQNTIFSDNIVYNNPDANPLNIGNNGNTGSGNKLNTNPKFTSLSLYNDNYWGQPDAFAYWASNLALQATSPGHNAGSDGKDIGLYGGGGAQNPLTGVPPIPGVTTMNILTTTVAPGATLSVQIKAKSNN